MARAGVYFSDVKRARDELRAAGRHPSIDAVRAALGNTGSKTTIHKYLREIEAEEGAATPAASEAILALVGQLADQLQREAATEIDAMRVQMAELRDAHERAQAGLEARLADLRRALDATSRELDASQHDGAVLKERLGGEQIARYTAEQHSRDLGERLADAQRHQASLEEKHRHARDALEHYRTAAKEQREQESRRHEQQVQGLQAELKQVRLAAAVKQEEWTHLNQQAAALASELGASKQALHQEREATRNVARKVEQLQPVAARVAVLEAQLVDSQKRIADAERARTEALELSNELCNELRQRNATLEAQLAGAKDASALEERLAKLDKAVFGVDLAGPSGVEASAD